jgi:hypothetical protein
VNRKRTAGDYFNLGIALLVVGVFLAVGVALIVDGITHHKTAELVGGGFMAAIGGALPVYLAFLLLQRIARGAAPGLAPPKIDLVLVSERSAPGSQVAGRVDVIQSGRVRTLEVTLACHDSSFSYKGVSWSSPATAIASGQLSAPGSYSFSIQLPPDAPPTFSFGGAAIWWEVDARCDVIGTDVHATKRIDVATPARVS